MMGLGRIPSGQTEDRERPKSFRGVVGDCEGGLPVGVLLLRRSAQSIRDFFLLLCFCSDSAGEHRPSSHTCLSFLLSSERVPSMFSNHTLNGDSQIIYSSETNC